MRIDGAGGCFDNRLYEVDIDTAWNIALLSINEMGVQVDDQDNAQHILFRGSVILACCGLCRGFLLRHRCRRCSAHGAPQRSFFLIILFLYLFFRIF